MADEEVKLKPKQKPHYVDNKKFLEAMTEYRALRIKAEEEGKRRPTVTNYIGECYLKIANHLSYRPNFINYTYRDDMISDGIENCLQYMDNFDPAKSKNPFAYFTQIIYYAFIRRIQKEKKQQHLQDQGGGYAHIHTSYASWGIARLPFETQRWGWSPWQGRCHCRNINWWI